MNKIIGIDPGSAGGIAVIDGQGVLIECLPMPETEHDIDEVFKRHSDAGIAYIEQVHSMPHQGVSSTFKFGTNYGFLRGMLVANRIRFFDVTPHKWQKALSLTSYKDEPKVAHKNRLKARAQQLFPKQKVTLKTADALLIAWYGYSLNR